MTFLYYLPWTEEDKQHTVQETKQYLNLAFPTKGKNTMNRSIFLVVLLACCLSGIARGSEDWDTAVRQGRELGIQKWCWYDVCFYMEGKTSGVARPGVPSKINSPGWKIKDTDEALKQMYVGDDVTVTIQVIFSVMKFNTSMLRSLDKCYQVFSARHNPNVGFCRLTHRIAPKLLKKVRDTKPGLILIKTPTEEDILPEDISEYVLEYERDEIIAISDTVIILGNLTANSKTDGRLARQLIAHVFDGNNMRTYTTTCFYNEPFGESICDTIETLFLNQPTFQPGLRIYKHGEYDSEIIRANNSVAIRPDF